MYYNIEEALSTPPKNKRMANKDRIIHLLSDIKDLESAISEMQGAEIYPTSFFSQSFDMTYKILKDIHSLEAAQIELLQQQMEEHQTIIQTISCHPNDIGTSLDYLSEQPMIETIFQTKESEKPVEKIKPHVEKTAIVQTPTNNPTTEKNSLFLSDIIEKKKLTDFSKALSLNDRFRFKKDLFGGDEAYMNKTLNLLNNMYSYKESIDYLSNELKWDMEDNTVGDFIRLLEKKFL